MSYYGQNPINALQSGLEQLKSGLQTSLDDRVEKIFEDIDPERSPLAYGIKNSGSAFFDLLDGTVHAVAELEKRLLDVRRDNAA